MKCRLWLVLAFCIQLTGLTGCGAILILGDPRWDPPTLSKTGCMELDGTYLNKGWLWDFAKPPPIIAPSRRIPESTMRLVTVKRLYKDKVTKDMQASAKKNGAVSIRREGLDWIFIMLEEDGTPYFQSTLHFDHPWAGCRHDNGALVIRRFLEAYYGETGGSAVADETEFYRLEDGSLEVRFRQRSWRHTMFKEPTGGPLSGRTWTFESVKITPNVPKEK